jgi:hypothetical protein
MAGLKLKLKSGVSTSTQSPAEAKESMNSKGAGSFDKNLDDILQFDKPGAEKATGRGSIGGDQNSSGGFADLKFKRPEQKKRRTNKYFYRVSNHHELFKVGRSYYSDYLSGIKSFAISSTGYQISQQKTVLGLASFFDHKEDLKIGIISDNLKLGAFKDIVKISKKVNYDYFGEENSILIYSFYNHFEFMDMNQLLELSKDMEMGGYEEIFDHIVDLYDIVFWDVPYIDSVQSDPERFFPVIMKFENISLIVANALSRRKDVENIKRFFLGYGINLKGVLVEEKENVEKDMEKINSSRGDKKKKAKRPWWRIFGK